MTGAQAIGLICNALTWRIEIRVMIILVGGDQALRDEESRGFQQNLLGYSWHHDMIMGRGQVLMIILTPR